LSNTLFISTSKIEELAKNANCTLENLLDEDDMSSVFNAGSTILRNLYSFVIVYKHSFNYERVEKLIDYIIIEPKPEDTDKRQFKYL